MTKTNITLGISILALFGVIFLTFTFYSPKSIVYVDSGRLLNEYQGMIDARAEYQKKSGTWQANIDTLQSEVTGAIMDYEKTVGQMTAKEKSLSQELIKTKQKQFQDYQRAIQQQAQQEDQAMTQQVIDKVNAFLEQYGEQKGYEIIFGTGQGNIVYAKEAYDITDEVVEELNNLYMGM